MWITVQLFCKVYEVEWYVGLLRHDSFSFTYVHLYQSGTEPHQLADIPKTLSAYSARPAYQLLCRWVYLVHLQVVVR